MTLDSKQRFSDRVNDYKKYRPSYPPEVINFIKDYCEIDNQWKVADIGSGTGISAGILLKQLGCTVFAIEPNENMRLEADKTLGQDQHFVSINGSAEHTTLEDHSIDMITSFQAFHWFNKEISKVEFNRILKEPKWISLIWNDRKISGSPFLEQYDRILRELPEYGNVNHKNKSLEDIEEFFGNKHLEVREFPNSQQFDFEGLKGRFFSSSYTPAYDTEEYYKQIAKLELLFDKTNINGVVDFVYTTEIYLGKLKY